MFAFKIFHRHRFIWLVVLHYTIYCIKITYFMCVFVCLALLALHFLQRQNCFLPLQSYYHVLTSGECIMAELCVHISSFLSLNDHSLLSILFLPPEQPVVVLTRTSYFNTHSLFHTVSAKNRHRSFSILLQ
jgi:hypothetical protein